MSFAEQTLHGKHMVTCKVIVHKGKGKLYTDVSSCKERTSPVLVTVITVARGVSRTPKCYSMLKIA